MGKDTTKVFRRLTHLLTLVRALRAKRTVVKVIVVIHVTSVVVVVPSRGARFARGLSNLVLVVATSAYGAVVGVVMGTGVSSCVRKVFSLGTVVTLALACNLSVLSRGAYVTFPFSDRSGELHERSGGLGACSRYYKLHEE